MSAPICLKLSSGEYAAVAVSISCFVFAAKDLISSPPGTSAAVLSGICASRVAAAPIGARMIVTSEPKIAFAPCHNTSKVVMRPCAKAAVTPPM
jgi:hypothetical protein